MTGGRQCLRRTCKYANYCWQHAKKVLGLQIRPSEIPGAGDGLYAAKEFKRGVKITDYGGRLYNRHEDIPPERDDYVVQVGTRFLEHSQPQDGYGRWANHCRQQDIKAGYCQGNNSQIAEPRTGDNAFLRATHRIDPGDEIYTSYGRSYWAKKRGTSSPPRRARGRRRKK